MAHSIAFEDLATVVYVWVDDGYQAHAAGGRQGLAGAKPRFSDSEVITLLLLLLHRLQRGLPQRQGRPRTAHRHPSGHVALLVQACGGNDVERTPEPAPSQANQSEAGEPSEVARTETEEATEPPTSLSTARSRFASGDLDAALQQRRWPMRSTCPRNPSSAGSGMFPAPPAHFRVRWCRHICDRRLDKPRVYHGTRPTRMATVPKTIPCRQLDPCVLTGETTRTRLPCGWQCWPLGLPFPQAVFSQRRSTTPHSF